MTDSSFLAPATIALHSGYRPESQHGARAVPIYQSTSYAFANVEAAAALFNVEQGGHIYSRISNPTVAVLEQRLAALEGGVAALATASGMSALFAAFVSLAGNGDHIVSAAQIYGSTATLLKHTLARFGIGCTFVDINDHAAVAAAIEPQTKLVFCESIGNPGLDVADIPALGKLAEEAGVPLIVDATFATPALCQPLALGAHIVVHSLTKWIGGHGAVLGGVLIDGGQFDWGQNDRFATLTEPYAPFHNINFWEEFGPAALAMRARAETMRDVGPALPAQSAATLLQGLESLNLRMREHVRNAHALGTWLAEQKNVAWVNHPDLPGHKHNDLAKQLFPKGAGSMLTFAIDGPRAAGAKFIDTLKLSSNLANVGDSRTLVLHPASTTHSRLDGPAMQAAGIVDGMVRVSVGLEDIDDIKADFLRGLKAAAKVGG